MPKQRKFTPEFESEAVRLVETSGRTQREIAEDLGISLTSLQRWISKHKDHMMDAGHKQQEEPVSAELKRLRRENEILRQERDILKRATAFFAKEGSR